MTQTTAGTRALDLPLALFTVKRFADALAQRTGPPR